MADNDLAEPAGIFVVTERTHHVVKRKYAIDDWFQPVRGYGSIHGDELRPAARKDDANRCDGP